MQGLSESEAISRRARGQGNDVRFRTTRTYLQIVRRYAFTFINTILFGISIVLIAMGQYGDALVTAQIAGIAAAKKTQPVFDGARWRSSPGRGNAIHGLALPLRRLMAAKDHSDRYICGRDFPMRAGPNCIMVPAGITRDANSKK